VSSKLGGPILNVPTTRRFTTQKIAGQPSRVLTLASGAKTIRISSSLVEVQRNLSHLRELLVLISLGGIGVAALLGAAVSRTAVAPLRRLTETTERIIDTGDLSERTGQRGRDEVSRLSARLDELLATLEASLRTQRQLVADASHELRTPIATLRANFEVLADPGALDAGERAEVLVDVRDELESITALVGELVELARGEELDVAPRDFRLDEVVQDAVDRAARRAPDLLFRTQLEPTVVTGVPERVERAVANLLDNARKWSPAGEAVDVAVHDGVVEVRDRGPGIAEEDLPLVFNRFYRSAKARGMPGAGLGLAIVKQIADAHDGRVTVDAAPGGGAVLRLQLSPIR
jgi:two-component system sensor histidine kinase MprB